MVKVKIITGTNFDDIKDLMLNVQKQARESNDKYHMYSSENFYIVGDDVYQRFKEEYVVEHEPSWWCCSNGNLTNKSSLGKIVTIYYVNYNYNASTNKEYIERPTKFYGVLVDGEIMRAWFNRNQKAAEFTLLGDMRDYYHKLYKWETDNPAPNKASMLTDKKVKDWVGWLKYRRELYDKIINEENDKVSKFLTRIKSLNIDGATVEINDTRGKIIKNNIKYTYHIEGGYIREELDINHKYGDDKLGTFLSMLKGEL